MTDQPVPRPAFHFTAPKNWLNDPNGLVFLDGEYHLFYQYNPDGMVGAGRNMHWGHAVSRDLLTWEHLPIAIHNQAPNQAYSGSAILDEQNLLKLQSSGGPAVIAAFYTRTGIGQCLAASTDRGRSWQEIQTVIPYASEEARKRCERDPRVFWHAATSAYILVLYERGGGYSFYRSTDLLQWKHASYLDGFFECPELVQLPAQDPGGNPTGQSQWVLFDGNGNYVLGAFDGFCFTPTAPKLASDLGPHFYATQCWLNAPGQRTIQLAWMRGGSFENCGFSQQMTVPCELFLRQDADGLLHLHRLPVRELPAQETKIADLASLEKPSGRFRMRVDTHGPDQATSVRGQAVVFSPRYHTMNVAGRVFSLPPFTQRQIELECVVDVYSIEIFIDQGRRSVSYSIPCRN